MKGQEVRGQETGISMIKVYGISNCDTVRKARRWLDEQGIDYQFHDYRKDGLTKAMLEPWVERLGWESLLNRRGTTWRQLPESVRAGIDGPSAVEVMLQSPAIIKRPLVDAGAELLLGFDATQWIQHIQA